MKVKKVIRKTFTMRPSGRSSDYIAPSFGYGCLLNCTYCYMKRHTPNGLTVAENINEILTEISNHSVFDTIEKPNQTDSQYITYDIACNEDFALHAKYYDWKKIFEFFKTHPVAKATLATKIIPEEFLEFNPEKKVRIRFSLMPQKYSTILEPNTPTIEERIRAINKFIEAGYDVHVNFSPVIVTNDWEEEYKKLFELLNANVKEKYKPDVKAEVIFLTHNEQKHLYNEEHNLPGEDLLWRPDIQEHKESEYGGNNLRYIAGYKKSLIKRFKRLHNSVIPWNTIRYCFNFLLPLLLTTTNL